MAGPNPLDMNVDDLRWPNPLLSTLMTPTNDEMTSYLLWFDFGASGHTTLSLRSVLPVINYVDAKYFEATARWQYCKPVLIWITHPSSESHQ